MSEFKIFHGDCNNILKSIPDCSIDCVITDPPYGISKMNHNWNSFEIKQSIKKSQINACTVKKLPVAMKFDPNDAKQLGKFLNETSSDLLRVLKSGSFCLVFSQARSSHHVAMAFENSGFEIRDQLIWDYGSGQGKAQGIQNFIKKNKSLSQEEKQFYITKLEGFKTPQLTPTFESIWLCQKPKQGTFFDNYLSHGVGLVDFRNGSKKVKFQHKKPSQAERLEASGHPTLKPVSLIEELIDIFCPENGVVLDCFMGSGTTGVACVKKNRNFIGIEKQKEYCDSSLNRILKYKNN
jgi:site-specific DNA-methyltransferase (adenine-specific)